MPACMMYAVTMSKQKKNSKPIMEQHLLISIEHFVCLIQSARFDLRILTNNEQNLFTLLRIISIYFRII